MSVTEFELFMLRKAFELAERGRYTCKPNPMVGCVIAQSGRMIGQGWHHQAGQPHAEINALRDCVIRNESPRGATMAVTLEPCSHTNRTPPCCDAIIEAGIKRVIIAGTDPNPEVNGKGIALLRQAGIKVFDELMPEQAQRMNAGFYKRHQRAMPWVTLKIASTLDGRIAAPDQSSRWITGADSQLDVHLLRLCNDAIITSTNTVKADNPLLTVRLDDSQHSIDPVIQPKAIILDSNLTMPLTANILQNAPIIFTNNQRNTLAKASNFQALGATLCQTPSTHQVALTSVLTQLADRGMNNVMVEAGSTLSSAFLIAGLVDEIILYQAPSFLGAQALPMLSLPNIKSITDQYQLKLTECSQLGMDIKLRLAPLS